MTDQTENPTIEQLTEAEHDFCRRSKTDPLHYAAFKDVRTMDEAQAAEEFLAATADSGDDA